MWIRRVSEVDAHAARESHVRSRGGVGRSRSTRALGVVAALGCAALCALATASAEAQPGGTPTPPGSPPGPTTPLLPGPDASEPAGADSGAPRTVRYDSTALDPRIPSSETLARYRAREEFDYGREFREPESLWGRFLRWLGGLWADTLGVKGTTTVWNVISWTILIGSFAFVVFKLVGADMGGLFARSNRTGTAAPIGVDEELETMDFPAAVAAAEGNGAFREAIRLHYLWALQSLNAAGSISWRRDKTDLDYARELGRSPARSSFERAAMLFSYVWYGDVPLDDATYRSVRDAIAVVRRPA